MWHNDELLFEQKLKLGEKTTEMLIKLQKEAANEARIYTIKQYAAAAEAAGTFVSMIEELCAAHNQRELDAAMAQAEAQKNLINGRYAEELTARENAHLAAIADQQMTAEEAMAIQTQLNDDLLKLEKDKNEALAAEDAKVKEAQRRNAEFQKAMAAAQGAINTYQAATQAMTSWAALGPVEKIAAMAAVIASGLSTVSKITATPIPSAETGGKFFVPQAGGVDGALMRVNSGEQVDVMPRSATGTSGQTRFIFQVDKQVVYDIVNEGLIAGDIVFNTENV